MKLWVDDVRPAPEGYDWVSSVSSAIVWIKHMESVGNPYKLIDLDHDAGDFFGIGGDYIEILKWLEETGRNYPIRIHTMNPVGAQNMRRIIQRNGWTEVHE